MSARRRISRSKAFRRAQAEDVLYRLADAEETDRARIRMTVLKRHLNQIYAERKEDESWDTGNASADADGKPRSPS